MGCQGSKCCGKSGSDNAEFQKSCLKAHNSYRSQHKAPPMVLNKKLCRMAQSYAEELVKKKTTAHCPSNKRMLNNKPVGENLAMGSNLGDGSKCVSMWYNEVKDYRFQTPAYNSHTGHFTQVVWKGSKELGVGVAKKADNSYVVVGRYFPAGNVQNHFKENVFPKS